MTKTATITCEFEYELHIGQLTPQDAELTSKMLGHGFIPTIDFYRVAEIFRGEVLPKPERDHLVNLVKDFLHGTFRTSLPRHFASNGRAKIIDICVHEPKYRDTIFIDQRNLQVCTSMHVIAVIEVTLDDHAEVDHDKLYWLIHKRVINDIWYSELDRYLSAAWFDRLEIEYR